jgi:type IV secretory pathway VirB4 component
MNLFKPQSGAINTLIAPHSFIDNHLYLTKRGAICATFEVSGIDFECLTDELLESHTQRLHAEFRNLEPEFRIYQHIIKTKGIEADYHRASSLYRIKLYRTLVYEPRSMERGFPTPGRKTVSAKDLSEHKRVVYHAAGSMNNCQLLAFSEVFEFLQSLQGSPNRTMEYSDHLDYWTAPESLQVHGRYLQAEKPTVTASLRELPRQSSPNMLRKLMALDSELIICTEWKRFTNEKANAVLADSKDYFGFAQNNRNKKAVFSNALDRDKTPKPQDESRVDKSAVKSIGHLGDLEDRINNEGELLGEFSLSLALKGQDYECLVSAASEAVSLFGSQEGRLEIDTFGTLETLLSMIPGNPQRRKFLLPSMNYADMALAFAPPVGYRINKHLGTESICVLETNFKTPYYFNLHEDDLLGALIFGVMGSGKSFNTAKFVNDSQKNKPFTFILDIGNSFRHLTAQNGGSYIELAGGGQNFTINPFDCAKTPKDLEFLSAFVHVLMDYEGYRPTPLECREIDKAVKVADRLSNLGLSADLMGKLWNWIGEGKYAYLFDNPRDTFSLAGFQCFDFQGVNEKLLEPLFFYIFQKISKVVYDRKNLEFPKQLIADEVWKMLKTQALKDYLVEAGKTWRKHNGGIVLTTQSALDLKKVGLLDVINEICPTKILLANPGANIRLYRRIFNLNAKEARLFMTLEKKKQFLLKTPGKSAVLSVIPTKTEIATFSNDPNFNIKRDRMIAEHGYKKAMQLLGEDAA